MCWVVCSKCNKGGRQVKLTRHGWCKSCKAYCESFLKDHEERRKMIAKRKLEPEEPMHG